MFVYVVSPHSIFSDFYIRSTMPAFPITIIKVVGTNNIIFFIYTKLIHIAKGSNKTQYTKTNDARSKL